MAFAPGFVLGEAKDMLALSAAIEDVHSPIIPNPPPDWNLLLDPPPMGPFDNKWQLWKRADGAFAIVVRGTIPKPGSILEDVIALMINAKGTIDFGTAQIDYAFAADPKAGAHLGFALGALLLLLDPLNGILAQLPKQQVGSGSRVYVTGHSQGAAVATLIRSYLEYGIRRPADLAYKTYVFAQPKPGNDHYAEDFENVFCKTGMAFCVNNTLDWVPQVPFTLQSLSDVDEPNPLSAVTHPLFETGLKGLLATVEPRALAQFKGLFAALAATVNAAPAGTGIPSLPIKPSLNYVSAGTVWPLIGTPCSGAECKDAFFEHHATTYYKLLSA
jgi:lipase (class 3)